MKPFLPGGVAAVVLAAVAPALAQVPAGGAAKVQTRAEVTARVERQFARYDANSDGAVTEAEVQARQAQRSELSAKRSDRIARRSQRGGDSAQRFARLDANRDGQIARAELDARLTARAQRRSATGTPARNGERMFARLDTDRNGLISRAEFEVRGQAAADRAERRTKRIERRAHGAAGQRMAGRFGVRMFAMADANKDGRLTLQEAQAAAFTHFDHADANRDG